MGLFSKFKDYNGALDEVLENKTFSSNVKPLLLSMIYKAETSYKDFYIVKRCVRKKEDFLNELIETVRLYCDNIQVVDPDSSQAKALTKHKMIALTNEEERSILTYSTEIALLYAISDISPKYFYINEEFTLKDMFQNMLVNGYNLNNVEILRDFNGWSWDISYDKNFDYVDNIIYQNLLMILGEKFLYEWRTYGSTRRDFLEETKNFIKIYTNNEKFIKTLYKVLYLKSSGKERRKLDIALSEKYKKLRAMSNKTKYLESCKKKKKRLEKKLEKYDIVLGDKKRLIKEFNKYNSLLPDDEKIKKIITYRRMILKEKAKCKAEFDDVCYALVPGNFSKQKKYLKETIDLYDYEDRLSDVIVNLQKEFLIFMDKKVSKMETRDELVDILFEMRYYSRIHLFKGKQIYDIDILANIIDKIQKKAITKLCKIGAIKIISMNINLNYEIIKYALDTQVINLENVKIYLDADENGLVIKIFDKDNFEKQGRKKIRINARTLEVRLHRKLNLFN